MQDTIRILEEIQRIDIEIAATEEEELKYLREISEAEAEGKDLEGVIEKNDAEMNELSARMKDLDEEIRKCAERVQKDEKRIGGIKNDKELNALNKEIAAANKTRKLHEDDKARLQAKFDEKKAARDEGAGALSGKNGRAEALRNEMTSKKAAWDAAVAKGSGLKDAAKARISPAILKKYESIRAKRGGIGLVKVKDETCLGCFIHIPPQVYIQIKKGASELMTCPHCHRILYADSQEKPEKAV